MADALYLWGDTNSEERLELYNAKKQGKVIEWCCFSQGKWDTWSHCYDMNLWDDKFAYRVKPELVDESDFTCKTCHNYLDDCGTCGECEAVQYDMVSKPSHYNQTGIECIDYIKQVLGLEGFIAYCRGNVIKYNHRAFYKGNPSEDMAKAAQYLKWANQALGELHK
jgi:hypothetical protein